MADSTEISDFEDKPNYFPSLQIDLECLYPEQCKKNRVAYKGKHKEISYTEDVEMLLPSLWRRGSRRLSIGTCSSSLVDDDIVCGGSEIVCNTFLKLVNLQSLLCSPQRNFLVNKHGTKFQVEDTLFNGKFVLICCFLLPVDKGGVCAKACRAIIAARNELLKERICSLEVVIVAKMRHDWDRKVVFDHFLSGFPDDVLAIPFWDTKSRDSVCKTLHLTGFSTMNSLLLDPQGAVLGNDVDRQFSNYGADFYPFTEERLSHLYNIDHCTRFNLGCLKSSSRRLSLEVLLRCTTLSSIVPDKSLSVKSLNNKLVLIYLCQTGDFLDKLHQFHQKCISHHIYPVILLVCQPFTQEPNSFSVYIEDALRKRSILSWWLVPYNDSGSRMLWRLTYDRSDQVIILPPDTSMSAELFGKYFISKYCLKSGSGSMSLRFYYPFTRDALVESKCLELKSLTLHQLLKDHTSLLEQKGIRIPMYRLRNQKIQQKILLYLDNFLAYGLSDEKILYEVLLNRYSDIKVQHKDCEVIFVPLEPIDGELVPEMPWITLPSPCPAIADQLFYRFSDNPYSTILSFGEDGHICSLNAQRCLYDDADSDYYDFDFDYDEEEDEEQWGKSVRVDISNLFDDNLRQEVYDDVMEINNDDCCQNIVD